MNIGIYIIIMHLCDDITNNNLLSVIFSHFIGIKTNPIKNSYLVL